MDDWMILILYTLYINKTLDKVAFKGSCRMIQGSIIEETLKYLRGNETKKKGFVVAG